ncbi:hypothetical protein [Streptomyces griseoluteus]|uniref:hypothetical protein n=1 Tax=Streptomyces griseoluteus TaxID=29306 RepID=UPI003437E464
MLLFTKLCAQLTVNGSPQLQRFLQDCGQSIRAVVALHAESSRYASSVTVTDDPPDGLDPSPLNIPSISWWWQQLN